MKAEFLISKPTPFEQRHTAGLAVSPDTRRLAAIIDCITQRCTEPELTGGDVAKSQDISVRTLHRAFAATNATFGGKLVEGRARVALRMLTSPLLSRVVMTEIGRRAGFLSASHFARVMRNQTGHTPLHLRRAAGTKKPEVGDLN
jgi:transcriptional regulator GlxA family with amidase domain